MTNMVESATQVDILADGIERLPDELSSYPKLLATLLFNRGITDKKEAERFLNPEYERDLYSPLLILGMEQAVTRILRAIAEEEQIVIYGDYDCDGIPGSVIL